MSLDSELARKEKDLHQVFSILDSSWVKTYFEGHLDDSPLQNEIMQNGIESLALQSLDWKFKELRQAYIKDAGLLDASYLAAAEQVMAIDEMVRKVLVKQRPETNSHSLLKQMATLGSKGAAKKCEKVESVVLKLAFVALG